jgi:serpin B
LDVIKINQAMANLVTTLERADSSVEITVANSLWGRQGFPFSDAFLETTRGYYRAQITTLDFDSPDAPDEINRWVNDATRGKIENIVDQIPPEIVLHLINAIYFKGQWEIEFDPVRTRDMDFHVNAGKKTTVPMMSHSGSYRHLAGDDFQAVRLPYGTGGLAMYVFLPDDTAGLDAFLAGLDEGTWTQWVSSFRTKNGDVSLPRFKIEYKCLLNAALREMGMGIAFDGGQADFSRMTSTDADLYISKVVHKAVVEVNEEGTEAAAVTDISIGVTAVRPEQERFRFIADHPFFFVIHDDRTGSIIFVGVLNDPGA